jgi:PAS domain S-box-containing protein
MLIITLVALFLLFYPLILRPKSKLTIYFTLLISSTFIWCAGYTIQISVTEFDLQMFLIYIQYIGIVTLTPLFLLFILAFTNRDEISSNPLVSLIFLPPLIHYLLLITNFPFEHYLFYQSAVQITTTPFYGLDIDYGPAFWSHTIYSYALVMLGIYFLAKTYIHESKTNILYRKQLSILLISVFFPLIGNIIRVVNTTFKLIIPILFLDLTPIFFIICYILFAYALYEVGLLDIVPIARQRVFDEISDGLIVIDQYRRLVDLNNAARNILLPSADLFKVFGRNILDVLKLQSQQEIDHQKIEEARQALDEIEKGILPYYSTELEFLRPQQRLQRIHYHLLVTPLKQKNDKILGFVGILSDITDRKEAERSLQEKSNLQQLILRLLSHDLRNHLNVLKGYSELATDANETEDLKESLKAIDIKSDATLQLIEEVTSYLEVDNMLRSQEFKKYDLVKVINRVVQQLKPEFDSKNIQLKLKLPSSPANILANLAINSVMLNLLMNAIKFSPLDGVVSITLEEKLPNWIIKFSDEGHGIPDSLKEKVFEPFAAFGEKGGTGLGLTIVKETIQFFSGKVWIEDSAPKGTIFIIEIMKFE